VPSATPGGSDCDILVDGIGRPESRDGTGPSIGEFRIPSSCGKYHFNLLAANGQVIATSESYERKQSALHGIESVKENAPGAEVDDQTGE
jgi:uncharacterized protein